MAHTTHKRGILLQEIRNTSPWSLEIPARLIVNGILKVASIASSTQAPATTPGAIGDIHVNTTASTVYVAGGTSASTDWIAVN
jgi:hypothetical protein